MTDPSGALAPRPGRVVLFGATGYTGRLTAAALVRAGIRPVLAGRSRDRLTALAAQVVPTRPLDVAVASATEPASVRALLHGPDDVLITTVGPFTRWGQAAVDAAIDAGSAYVDSTGEPPFLHELFTARHDAARLHGARLIPAFGYDYVPGNLAAALALRTAEESGRSAARIDVGYFVDGPLGVSGGTRASAAGVFGGPSYVFRHGTLQPTGLGFGVRAFYVAGTRRSAMAVGGSEHLALPRLSPQLSDVGVWLGWAGSATWLAALGGAALGGLAKVPVAGRAATSVVSLIAGRGSTGGPNEEQRRDSRTVAVAEAVDAVGRPVARVHVVGPSPYDLTAELLTWAAGALLARRESGPGVLGPVDAFGLDALQLGCADLGLVRVG